jgi:hypothetical protein
MVNRWRAEVNFPTGEPRLDMPDNVYAALESLKPPVAAAPHNGSTRVCDTVDRLSITGNGGGVMILTCGF